MNLNFGKLSDSAQHMIDSIMARLPSLVVAIAVFVLFYILSIFVGRIIRSATRAHRQNLGMAFARLIGAGIILLGFLVAFSIVAPSFQAGDLIKVLGIGSVAIGFAFQNILQNFLTGLLLLWAEPFRVGDEIKLDPYEGTVEEIQARATISKTYDQRRVVIPNADLFTHSVIVNTAFDIRRWEHDLTVKSAENFEELRSVIVNAVKRVAAVLSDPGPEALLVDLGDPGSNILKLRILWWTKSPRQHEMLTSYDSVLTAIRQALSRYETGGRRDQGRAA